MYESLTTLIPVLATDNYEEWIIDEENDGTGEIPEGSLPPRALAMVRECLGRHRDTLREIRGTQEFRKIPPSEQGGVLYVSQNKKCLSAS